MNDIIPEDTFGELTSAKREQLNIDSADELSIKY